MGEVGEGESCGGEVQGKGNGKGKGPEAPRGEGAACAALVKVSDCVPGAPEANGEGRARASQGLVCVVVAGSLLSEWGPD